MELIIKFDGVEILNVKSIEVENDIILKKKDTRSFQEFSDDIESFYVIYDNELKNKRKKRTNSQIVFLEHIYKKI
jgi:hypothetical protein